MRSSRGWKLAVFAALAALVGAPVPGEAQQAEQEWMHEGPRVLSAGGHPTQPDLDLSYLESPFNLRAEGDYAIAGTRSTGQSTTCISNIGWALYLSANGCGPTPQFTRSSGGGYFQMYFDFNMGWVAPPSDMPDLIDVDETGLQGGGWTHQLTAGIASVQGGTDKIGPSDRGAELLNIGAQTTEDGSCHDFSSITDANLNPGFQLLPVSDCPTTHPPGGFQGRHLAEQEVYLDLFENDPTFRDGDPFAFWRVPEELQNTDRTIGDFQVYGEWNDYFFEALPRYGAVVPGGSGAPQYHGWPLGLEVRFDAFYFALPTVGGSTYWMATIVNNSADIYGEPIDYDSIYWAINFDPLIVQSASEYLDPTRSTIFHNTVGNGCALASDPNHPNAFCPSSSGFQNPSAGIVILKSPIGDLRYKQFSDPESDFFSPGHPLAGDTITIQHQHLCGFGGCYPNTLGTSQRSSFGMYSSTGSNVLDGRAPSDFGTEPSDYWRTFRPEDWPERTGEFNKYVPGVDDDAPIWDYNKDGVPDTIYADSCGSQGCVGIWSDTLPGGHINYYGNISTAGIGPFSLAAGDTTSIIMALVGAADSAGIEASVNNSIEFYQNFFLGPEAAPAPSIVAVDAEIGSVDDATITLFWDNAAEDYVDPFLSTLDVSGDAPLNPFLEDTIAQIAGNNVAALHLFKSCDGGNSFTSDGDCDGDPLSAADSKFSGFGWEPYRTFEAGDDGELPNTFTDGNITAGITYTYVLVTETRGAEFNLVRGEEGELVAETVEFAPSLLSSLSASSSNPFVATVYVPVNIAAGTEVATIDTLSRSGFSDIPINISLVRSATEGGTFRTVFVDSIVVEQTETLDEGEVVEVSTTVRGLQLRTDTEGEIRVINEFSFTRQGDLALSGLDLESTVEDEATRVTTFAGGAGMILVDEAGNRPLLASTTLSGAAATPGSFIGREDFPFFSISVNSGVGGSTIADLYISEEGDTIVGAVEPSVQFLGGPSGTLDPSQFGTYRVSFGDEVFGELAPFRIDQRGLLRENFEASVQGRVTATQSTTDPAAIEAVNEATGLSLSPEDVAAFNLPFTVQNVTYDRSVQIVVAEHQDSILLGQGADTVRVAVPGDNWVPGDVLYFVEQVEREVTGEDGGTVFENGQPLTETALVATTRVVLGCTGRESCDPTIGGAASTGYVTVDPGTEYFFGFFVPFTGGEEFRFRLDPAVQLAQVTEVSDSALANVHVVPNPYIFASAFERETADRVLKFTNLPPDGRIRIFDIAGRFVQELTYTQQDLEGRAAQGGDLDWDLTTREGLELSYGLYIFVLESDFGRATGKFVVIR